MNPFGDDRSFGIPGRSGKDTFDLIRWAPAADFIENLKTSTFISTLLQMDWYLMTTVNQ